MALNAWQKITRVQGGQPFGNGGDGALTISANTTQSLTVESCGGTSGSTTLTTAGTTLSNGDLIFIHQSRGTGVGQWEINRVSSGGGTTSLTLQEALNYTYTDSGASQAQAIKIPQYTNVTINNGITWSAPTWDGNISGFLVFAANGLADIQGTISASNGGYAGGVGDNAASQRAFAGEGNNVASARSQSTGGTGGGGGRNGSSTGGDGSGAGGGHSAAGENGGGGNAGDGLGGTTGGAVDLSTMIFGGAGGAGGGGSGGNGKNGGACGGGFLIIAQNLTISGNVISAGQNGVNGADLGGGHYLYSGGGGSGGAVLMQVQTATLGTNLITALKGNGGDTPNNANDGGNGADGRIALHYGSSYTGTTNPTLDATQDNSFIAGGGAFLFNLL